MAKNEQVETATGEGVRERKWIKPSKRAAGYAEERKKGVHMRGPKKGQELEKILSVKIRAIDKACFLGYNINDISFKRKRGA